MYTSNLREIEGSIVLTLPPSVLKATGLSIGAKVNISINGDRLVVEQRSRPSYTLEELLAQCDPSAGCAKEEREWLGFSAIGEELL